MREVASSSSLSQETSQLIPPLRYISTSGGKPDSFARNHSESSEWVSHLVEQIWPYLQRLFERVLLGTVEPALAASMPSSFPQLRFTKMVLGDTPPKVNGVRVGGERGESIVVEMDVDYDGKPEISIGVGQKKRISFGIDGLRLQGCVEVVIAPLMTEFPVYGAMAVSFLNSPEIQYELTGLATVAELQMLQRPFHKVLKKVLANQFVLPNRFVYKLVPSLDYFRFAVPLAAVLRVTVVKGNGFPNTDDVWWKTLFGAEPEPDVYLELRVGSITRFTKRIDDENDPVWNETHDFILSSKSKSQMLYVYAYDFNVGVDEWLGKTTIPLGKLVAKEEIVVRLRNSSHGAKPTVTLRAAMHPLSSEQADIRLASMARFSEKSKMILTILIDGAQEVRANSRPFVEVSIKESYLKQNFKTWTMYEIPGIQDPRNPSWETEMHCVLKKVVPEMKINFKVIDENSGDSLGTAFCTLSSILLTENNEKEFLFSLIGAESVTSTLRVKLSLQAVSPSPMTSHHSGIQFNDGKQ